jgi:hypothetical protein
MDAATAAAMSDPDMNPSFRRRWVEAPASPEPQRLSTARHTDLTAETGRALHEEWRQQRAARRSIDRLANVTV